MSVTEHGPAWLLLAFELPTKRASRRVEIWRKLRRYGALPLRNAGYLLPNRPDCLERLQWLATAIRTYDGAASVLEVHRIDDLTRPQLVEMFNRARDADYAEVARLVKGSSTDAQRTRLRRRLQDLAAIDYFDSPMRGRAEALLDSLERAGRRAPPTSSERTMKSDYRNRTWITRPRPGIDRAASAWLIRRFIDPKARFVFADDASRHPRAVPFDMFGGEGFGHRGDDCTIETLVKSFRIRDRKAIAVARAVHDADLGDAKFGRVEAIGIDRALVGWALGGVPDTELLRRGIELIEGLYAAT